MSDHIHAIIAAAAEAYWDQQSEAHEYIEFPGLAAAILADLKAARIVAIKLPSVAHKGPHDTDAQFYRQVSERLGYSSNPIGYLGGSNVRRATSELLCRAADASEADR